MNDVCEIIIVRHGETIANKTGILQGHLDTALSETGILQADAVARRLKKQHFDIVYCSDLERAMTTAEKIAVFHPDLKIIPSPELREWNLGDLQGRLYNELINEYPEIMGAFKKDNDIPFVPGGESSEAFHQRIVSFFDRIAAENTGKRVLLVTHGGVMQRILLHTTGHINGNNIRPLCANASLSVFKYKSGKWQLITWNDTAHLENIEMHDTLTF